ncbi:hypothetical protein AGDE_06854 [Angomonas deanei]|nr:hypothetical protein AGDE_06854 [Angomonas deanei]|eukprot:EPY36565.1 hypothetical protein AGDE_06854 [Angomonas deanei]
MGTCSCALFIFTSAIVIMNIYLCWSILGRLEYYFVLFLVIGGFISAFQITVSDPGIYPRLLPGEVDPLGDDKTHVFCKVCLIRRPRRAAHCYDCNVCVLEHDHHCGVLGGCVGIRTLRFFTLFLQMVSIALCFGISWMIRYIIALSTGRIPRSPTTSTTSTSPRPLLPGQRRRDPARGDDIMGFQYTVGLLMLLVDLCTLLMVGGMACLYLYLTLASKTRRESKRSQNSCSVLLHPRLVYQNLMRTLFPPPSLVSSEVREEFFEMDSLV